MNKKQLRMNYALAEGVKEKKEECVNVQLYRSTKKL